MLFARAALAAASLLAGALPARAAVEVKTDAAGRVSVRADAPASEVLDRLGAQTGMKVVYEGAPPRTRVNVAFEQRSPAEAVLKVLEGLGYDYLVRFDRSGTRPELLIVSGPSSGAMRPGPAMAATSPARPARAMPPVEDDEDEEGLDEADEAQEVPAVRVQDLRQRAQPAPAPTSQPAFGAQPAPSYPVSPFAPAAPGLPTVVAPPTPAPESQDAPPNDNPNT